MASIDAENLRAELRAAIAETDDAHARASLLLMQGLYEITAAGFRDLTVKIDSVLSNEKELRDKVLNGHAPDFDVTMKWVKGEMAFSPRQKSINRWVEERMQSGGYCDYAARKVKEEEEVEADNKRTFRQFRNRFIERLFWLVLGAAGLGAIQMIK